ncbi:hypothetical protein HOY80DRAFT_1041320 [Tuber brumale]|nr:hypothetical protein HOY80DRAFT_1041320 [Tuber brumale]
MSENQRNNAMFSYQLLTGMGIASSADKNPPSLLNLLASKELVDAFMLPEFPLPADYRMPIQANLTRKLVYITDHVDRGYATVLEMLPGSKKKSRNPSIQHVPIGLLGKDCVIALTQEDESLYL